MQVSDFSSTDGQHLKTDTALLGRLRVPAGNRATGIPSGEGEGRDAGQADAGRAAGTDAASGQAGSWGRGHREVSVAGGEGCFIS